MEDMERISVGLSLMVTQVEVSLRVKLQNDDF